MANGRVLAKVLTELARTLVTDYSGQVVLQRLVRRVPDVLPGTGAGVLIGSHRDMRFVAASDEGLLGVETLQLGSGAGPCFEAFRTGEAVLLPDLAFDERFPQFSALARSAGRAAAVLALPMFDTGKPIGALDLYLPELGGLDDDDAAAARVLADVGACYMINWQARKKARKGPAARPDPDLHDGVTGLPNRSLLRDRLQQARARGQRSELTTAVLSIDLEGVQSTSDGHSQQVGDEVLSTMAQRLRKVLRPSDMLGRLPGHQFLIVVENVHDPRVAEHLASRVADILAKPLTTETIGQIDLTTSVDVAFAGPARDLPTNLLDNGKT